MRTVEILTVEVDDLILVYRNHKENKEFAVHRVLHNCIESIITEPIQPPEISTVLTLRVVVPKQFEMTRHMFLDEDIKRGYEFFKLDEPEIGAYLIGEI